MKKSNPKNNHEHSHPGMKTCFVCKMTAPRSEMLRFIGQPGQMVQFDAREILPGRGMWLHANRACLKKAITNKIFYRAAKGTVIIPENLMDDVCCQLAQYPEKFNLFNQGGIHE